MQAMTVCNNEDDLIIGNVPLRQAIQCMITEEGDFQSGVCSILQDLSTLLLSCILNFTPNV